MAVINDRHRGTGVDISGAQIALARKNVPGATFVHGDMSKLDFPASSFDAIVSFYTIEHLPRERHAERFGRFASWLRPGGRLLFTLEP